MGSLKRHHLITLKRDKKIGCTATSSDESPTTSLIKFESDSPASASSSSPECCQVPYLLFLKQLGWRVRSRWRQFLIRRRRCNGSGLRFNYDLRSYAQNFDDGRRSLHDRCSPLAP